MTNWIIKLLGLLLVWIILTRHAGWLDIVGGLALGWLALRMDVRGPEFHIRPRPLDIAKIFFHLCHRIVVGAFAVCRDVLVPGRKQRLCPAFLALPLESAQEMPAAITANSISLSPGSVTIHADLERRRLYFHSLYANNPDEILDQSRREYLEPAQRVFREREA